jgi:ATP-dependent DNA helicase RecG
MVDADMPQGNRASRDTILKVLRLEISTGLQDSATTCGLEAFVEQHLPGASSLAAGYAAASEEARRRIVDRLISHLETREPGASPDASRLDLPATTLKGVGKKRADALGTLGIRSVEDLLFYFPRRLEDRSQFTEIGRLRPGESAAVRGEVLAVDRRRAGRGMTIVKAAIGDGSGFLYAVWFNQPWIADQLERGERIDVFGRAERSHGELQMRAPIWEPAETHVDVGRLTPIYPATEGVSDRLIRSLIDRHLDATLGDIAEILPESVRSANGLHGRREAIRAIHRPANVADFDRARRTLAFEELLLLQLGLLSVTRDTEGISRVGSGDLVNSFLAGLPFTLTASQASALREIEEDLSRPIRMMRLLQGDVGAGKTLVALIAALAVIESGAQAAFMVPTEILAEQHAATIDRLLGALPVRTSLLTGAASEKQQRTDGIRTGEIDLVVGTHALIQEAVGFANLGLVIIDEQHRFGVVQRSAIEQKGDRIDLLVMSATPIPRTIALTLYGEFDVSTLDELPVGDRRIETRRVPLSKRDAVYRDVADLLRQGKKGYVVLPLVEESEKVDAASAIRVSEELRDRFPEAGVGLIHGRVPAAERNDVMEAFVRGDVRLLVATTVIEVGIDVQDADFMVIEHADRFGLSQLHQLRGRIGRSGQEAVCVAITDAKGEEAKERLDAFESEGDGFAIAEADLRIRGPGDLLGTQQHGFLSQLRAVDLIGDLDLISRARAEARRIHAEDDVAAYRNEIDRRFGELLRWLRV